MFLWLFSLSWVFLFALAQSNQPQRAHKLLVGGGQEILVPRFLEILVAGLCPTVVWAVGLQARPPSLPLECPAAAGVQASLTPEAVCPPGRLRLFCPLLWVARA